MLSGPTTPKIIIATSTPTLSRRTTRMMTTSIPEQTTPTSPMETTTYINAVQPSNPPLTTNTPVTDPETSTIPFTSEVPTEPIDPSEPPLSTKPPTTTTTTTTTMKTTQATTSAATEPTTTTTTLAPTTKKTTPKPTTPRTTPRATTQATTRTTFLATTKKMYTSTNVWQPMYTSTAKLTTKKLTTTENTWDVDLEGSTSVTQNTTPMYQKLSHVTSPHRNSLLIVFLFTLGVACVGMAGWFIHTKKSMLSEYITTSQIIPRIMRNYTPQRDEAPTVTHQSSSSYVNLNDESDERRISVVSTSTLLSPEETVPSNDVYSHSETSLNLLDCQ